ncbi:hypothetical protein AB0I49_21465 [Streptomyces sp. NPDC050617]|uniref:hypothetical protein n=1 Tax=Streptomyces sp. NPDC050617 TaxID=3154628 RepID=UPI003448CAA8
MSVFLAFAAVRRSATPAVTALLPAVVWASTDIRRPVPGHARLGVGELAGGVDVAGLNGPEVVEGADGSVRSTAPARRCGDDWDARAGRR